MRTLTIAVLAALIAALASDLSAQRRGRFQRTRRPEAPAPEPEKKEEPPAGKPKTHKAVVGGDVYLGTGQRMTDATILIGDDKILAVGTDLELPDGTEVIDARGKVVCPGFVAVQASGMGAGRSGPFIDSVNPFDPEIKQGLAAGITSFLAGNPGGGNSPSGDNAVIKLAYGDVEGMVAMEDSVVGLSLPLGIADFAKLKESVEKAREHLKAMEEFRARKPDPKAKPPEPPQGSENLLKVLEGKARLWVSLGGGFRYRGGGGRADDVATIRQALEVARLIGQGVVLQRPISAWLLADEIGATESMVILSPRDRVDPDPADPEHSGSNIASAAILAKAGVPVAVTTPAGGFGGGNGVGTGGILGQDLNTPQIDAAFAVRGGMDDRQALRTITLDAARMIGADSRLGSIEPGKDADILILDGDPLHYRTFVQTALVNGKVVYQKDKEPFYSHIHR
ncbi:MAG: amidohydrolase [Planctomycetota bacterium]